MTKWEGHVLDAAWAAARIGERVVITYTDAGFAVKFGGEMIPIEEAVVRCLVKLEQTNDHRTPLHYSARAQDALGWHPE